MRNVLPALLLITTAASVGWSQDAYLFTSFRGDGDGLHLAYSEDGREWVDLNRVFLKPTVGSKLMRDPHILRGPDGLYHMVWTSGWHDTGIGYSNSRNLTEWTKQRYLPLMENVAGTKTCWAPELYYDGDSQSYIIVWSSNVNDHIRAYYTLTRDFETFTEPKMLFNPDFNN